MTTLPLFRVTSRTHWLLWSYLLIVTAAETITAILSPHAGMILHALLVVILIAHAVLVSKDDERHLAIALILAPMIRVFSLSLPLTKLPQTAWYPIVAVPLLIGAWSISRQAGVSRQALGLQPGNIAVQLMLAGGGLVVGGIEYFVLHPTPMLTTLSWESVWLPVLSLVIFTGFTEELIFRGLLQSLAKPVMGRWALLYVSALFGVLHIGYFSVIDVIYVAVVGLIFAQIVTWCRSILGVTLAHGVANVTLFILLPYTAAHPASTLATVLPWAIGAGALLWIIAVAILAIQGRTQMNAQSVVDRVSSSA
jgi:uncharacterized protein